LITLFINVFTFLFPPLPVLLLLLFDLRSPFGRFLQHIDILIIITLPCLRFPHAERAVIIAILIRVIVSRALLVSLRLFVLLVFTAPLCLVTFQGSIKRSETVRFCLRDFGFRSLASAQIFILVIINLEPSP
jgi:hypothetical protein